MKRILWKSMLALGVILSAGMSSCTDSKTDDPNPGPGPDPGPDPSGNTFVTTDCVTPLRYTEEKYIGGNEGVSIDVIDNSSDNIRFTITPSAEIKAYRVTVYPVSSLYNTLLNQLNTETELDKYTYEQVNELIKVALSVESETSGGKLMNEKALGADYASYEFDWMNSGYSGFKVSSDASYLIAVQSYFDAEGKATPGDLCLCHVHTPEKALVGNPAVELNVVTNYIRYQVTHVPNEDCNGYYYLSSTTAAIQQYIDAYGEKTYMELLRHYGALIDVASKNFTFVSNEEKQGVEYCTTALAVDVNGTPAKNFARSDFFLEEVPADSEEAKGTVSVPHKVSATVCHFNVHMDKSSKKLVYYVHPAAKADQMMAMDEDQRRQIAQVMVKGGSESYPKWTAMNPNYGIDPKTGKLIGSDYDGIEYQHELADNTDYKIIYAFGNGYGIASDLMVTDAFTTKTLVKDKPETCTAETTLEISGATRNAFYLKSTYNRDNTARIYFQYYAPLPEGHNAVYDDIPAIEDGSDDARYREKGWLYWFLEFKNPDPFQTPWTNENVYLLGDGIGVDTDFWDGFDPGITYYFAYMMEDWNGVLSPVKFFDGTTQSVNPGEHPTVAITATKQQNGDYKVTFKANDETASLKYMGCRSSNATDVQNLQLTDLLKPNFGDITYEEYKAAWEDYTMRNGLPTTSLTATLDIPASDDIATAVAIPIGADAKGNPVYGEMQTLIFRKGSDEVKSLQEYMGVPAAANMSSVMRMNTQKPVRIGTPLTDGRR